VSAPAAAAAAPVSLVDSGYASFRLGIAVLIMTLGASVMYVVPVILPAVQSEFGVARADASLPYSLLMIGFGIGGLFMGRLSDRFGVAVPLAIGAAGVGSGFIVAGTTSSFLVFNAAHAVLLGLLGGSATFSPLVADTTLWFAKRRGIAVAICASGNYLGGAVWPPLVQRAVEAWGWRATYVGMGVICAVAIGSLALLMRRRPPIVSAAAAALSRLAA